MTISITTISTRPDTSINFNFKNENDENYAIWDKANTIEENAIARGIEIEINMHESDDGLVQTTTEVWSTLEKYIEYTVEVYRNSDFLASMYFNQLYKKSKNITDTVTFEITQ